MDHLQALFGCRPGAAATLMVRTAMGRPVRSASRSSFERIRASDSRIRIQGVELHMSDTFRALGVSEAVEQALAARGITEPFRIQTLVLPDALEGRDILAKAQTGSG